MPKGVPVATVAIGKWGAANAGLLAAQILALGDAALAARLAAYRKRLADEVDERAPACRRAAEVGPAAEVGDVTDAEHSRVVAVDPVAPTPATLRAAADTLRAGGVVALPTETFYGLAAAALHSGSVRRDLRAEGQTRIQAAPRPRRLGGDGEDRGACDRRGARPHGPLLARSPDARVAGPPHRAIARDGRNGDPGSSTLASCDRAGPGRALGEPVTAPSANPDGLPPPTTAARRARPISRQVIDLVLDGGATPGGSPRRSSISPWILRRPASRRRGRARRRPATGEREPCQTSPHMKITGVIQAGGQSRRMGGRPKALIELGGRRIIERVLAALAPAVDDVLVVTNTPELYAFLNLPMVADVYPDRGSLGGIYSGLEAASGRGGVHGRVRHALSPSRDRQAGRGARGRGRRRHPARRAPSSRPCTPRTARSACRTSRNG